MAGLLEQLDGSISDILAAWNIYTTLIAFSIVGFPPFSGIFGKVTETPHGCMYTSLYAAAVTTNLG